MNEEADDFVKSQLRFINNNPSKEVKPVRSKPSKTIAQRLMSKPIAMTAKEKLGLHDILKYRTTIRNML